MTWQRINSRRERERERFSKINPNTLKCWHLWFVYGLRNVGIIVNCLMFCTKDSCALSVLERRALSQALVKMSCVLKTFLAHPWSVILFQWVSVSSPPPPRPIQITDQHNYCPPHCQFQLIRWHSRYCLRMQKHWWIVHSMSWVNRSYWTCTSVNRSE